MADPAIPTPERRRRRPAVSCTLCRKRKIRCNRESPCSNCVRSKNLPCVYENHQPSPLHNQTHGRVLDIRPSDEPHDIRSIALATSVCPSSATDSAVVSVNNSYPSTARTLPSTSSSSPASQPSSIAELELMKEKIKHLEDLLSKANPGSTYPPLSTTNFGIPSKPTLVLPLKHDSQLFGKTEVCARCLLHKGRMFGRSHWINGVALFDIFENLQPYARENNTAAFRTMQRCKTLGKLIKSRREPEWPCPPTLDLPARHLADQLVERYFQTTELIYRILHVPTFRKDYEKIWTSDTTPDTTFMVTLKLVMAIGAAFYDEPFSLRDSAIRWVYEAQTWLSRPEFKIMLSVRYLQAELLLLVAREMVGVAGGLVWLTFGTIYRNAIQMGFHRDPKHLPKKNIFVTEMRRRLWNTILELSLQAAMTAGTPPHMSLEDFDTEPPQNYDDEQLLIDDALPKPEDQLTDVSVAKALRVSFPLRLEIARYLNNINYPSTYDDTLRLDGEFRTAYRLLCRQLQACHSPSGDKPPEFAMLFVDLIMRRFHSSIHVPYFGLSLSETAYAFTRKVVLELSLKIWSTISPSSFKNSSGRGSDPQVDFARAAIGAGGHGFFHTTGMQASCLIAAELRTQVQEDEGLSPLALRQDLIQAVEDSKNWSLRALETGDTNIKGYLLKCLMLAEIDGLKRGLNDKEMLAVFIKAVEESQATCLEILERKAMESQQGGDAADGLGQMSLNEPADIMGDLDFMMSDAQFNFDDEMDTVSWLLSTEPSNSGPAIW